MKNLETNTPVVPNTETDFIPPNQFTFDPTKGVRRFTDEEKGRAEKERIQKETADLAARVARGKDAGEALQRVKDELGIVPEQVPDPRGRIKNIEDIDLSQTLPTNLRRNPKTGEFELVPRNEQERYANAVKVARRVGNQLRGQGYTEWVRSENAEAPTLMPGQQEPLPGKIPPARGAFRSAPVVAPKISTESRKSYTEEELAEALRRGGKDNLVRTAPDELNSFYEQAQKPKTFFERLRGFFG